MKKQWRMVIISGVVLIALLATWLISTLVMPGDSKETTTATTTAAIAPVFETKAENITQIEINNEKGGFTLLPEQTKDKDGKISVIWHVKGQTTYPFSSSKIDEIATLATNVYASKEVTTNATDLASFGLDKSSTSLTITLKSGEKHVVNFGKEIVSGYFDYVNLDGGGRVCTIPSSSADLIKQTTLDLLDDSLVMGIEKNDLTYLAFERARDQVKIAMDCKLVGEATDENAYLEFTLTEPIKRAGSADMLATLATEATGFSVTKFVEIDPKDLTKYGLDRPQYTFTLRSKEKSIVVKIGKSADSSSFYAISDTVPAVFTVASSSFTTVDMKVIEMIDRFVALESIWNVKKIEANLFGTKFTTEIDMTKDQKASDEGVAFRLDGENAKIFSEDDDSLYTNFYQRIIGMMLTGLDTTAKPVNKHEASLTFTIEEDAETKVPAHTKVVEFTKRDDYTYYVFIDGAYAGFYVDGESAFTSTKTDGEGILVSYKMLKYAMAHAVDGVFNTEEGYHLN